MYTLGHRFFDTNGYVLVYLPDHHRAIKSGSLKGYVYEHMLVAERMLDRHLTSVEEVHHLDQNRSNNSPDNLLVLIGPMHSKLHGWMNKHVITPTTTHQERIDRGCVRCKTCQEPIHPDDIYCSPDCSALGSRKVERPTKEQLVLLLETNSFLSAGRLYGVSDNAIRKWCHSYDINPKTLKETV